MVQISDARMEILVVGLDLQEACEASSRHPQGMWVPSPRSNTSTGNFHRLGLKANLVLLYCLLTAALVLIS